MKSAWSPSHYPFDNAAPQAAARLATLSALYDGVTCRHLDGFGIGEGWCCLEVGAGNGSVAAFMKDRVGADAQVIATDINPVWMAESLPTGVDVLRHDIGVDPLPASKFDVIHARAVLAFVPQPRSTLRRMIDALAPGGWILVEELTPPATEVLNGLDDPDIRLAHKARKGIIEVISRAGDLTFLRDVPTVFTDVGLRDIGTEGFFLPFRTDAVAGLARANIDELEQCLVEAGLMSPAELDRYRLLLERPDVVYPASMALISVWGRRELA